jgi:hypothetical protein
MPQRKQPMCLEDLALRECTDIYCRIFEDWMNTLYSADQIVEEAHSLADCHISGECREMEEEISILPPALLRVLSPRLAAEYVKFLSRPQLRTASTVKKD